MDFQFKLSVDKVGQWVCDQFESYGFECELIEICGYLLVYVELLFVEGWLMVFVYGYYDVQLLDFFEEWIILLFELMVCGGNVYVWGVIDDKG